MRGKVSGAIDCIPNTPSQASCHPSKELGYETKPSATPPFDTPRMPTSTPSSETLRLACHAVPDRVSTIMKETQQLAEPGVRKTKPPAEAACPRDGVRGHRQTRGRNAPRSKAPVRRAQPLESAFDLASFDPLVECSPRPLAPSPSAKAIKPSTRAPAATHDAAALCTSIRVGATTIQPAQTVLSARRLAAGLRFAQRFPREAHGLRGGARYLRRSAP